MGAWLGPSSGASNICHLYNTNSERGKIYETSSTTI